MLIQHKPDLTGANLSSPPKWILSRRLINALGFVICSLLLTYAYYLEFYQNLQPCPLCTLQRLAFAVLGFVFLIAAVHNPWRWGGKIYAALIALTAGIGAGIAGRHVWLQIRQPEEAVVCLPGLDYLLKAFPFTEALHLVLFESGDCSGIDWTFLGLSMPTWTLLAFLSLGMVGTVRNWR